MKTLNEYIIEGLKINSKTKVITYSCKPQNKKELKNIIEERLNQNKDANLNDIDVSNITDMSDLFNGLDPHNIDISEWDVSNVTNMYRMFFGCDKFNSNLSNWNVSNVEDMRYMFYECPKFNCDLNNWDVSNVKDMDYMLYRCDSLKNKPSWYKE